MTLSKPVPATPPFVIRRSRVHGRGAFASRRIRKGERIGEYVGERISQTEGDRRYDDDRMTHHHTFLFTVSPRVVIDAAVGGNDTRLINHSCAPNCEAVIEDRRVFIDAIRTIPAGAELSYDYAYERDDDAGPEAEARYPCRCGAPRCRGTILAPAPRRRRRKRGSVARRPRAGGSKRGGTRAARKGGGRRPERASARRPASRPATRPVRAGRSPRRSEARPSGARRRPSTERRRAASRARR